MARIGQVCRDRWRSARNGKKGLLLLDQDKLKTDDTESLTASERNRLDYDSQNDERGERDCSESELPKHTQNQSAKRNLQGNPR